MTRRRKKAREWPDDAKARFYAWLASHGIEDEVRVEVWAKLPRVGTDMGLKAIGSYARRSQWNGPPILRLSTSLPRHVHAEIQKAGVLFLTPTHYVAQAAAETLAHEYGHVIWEFIELSSAPHPGLLKLRELLAKWSPSADDREEDFAEALVYDMRGVPQHHLREILDLYAAVLRSERERVP